MFLRTCWDVWWLKLSKSPKAPNKEIRIASRMTEFTFIQIVSIVRITHILSIACAPMFEDS